MAKRILVTITVAMHGRPSYTHNTLGCTDSVGRNTVRTHFSSFIHVQAFCSTTVLLIMVDMAQVGTTNGDTAHIPSVADTQNLACTLEAAIAERSTHAKLDATRQKGLEQAKDEFISLISHQLRTPLTVIRVYGEMFASGHFGQLTKTQEQHIARMTDASIRLINLVDGILDLSRMKVGDYHVAREWTDLGVLLHSCIQDIQPLADGKHVQLSFTFDASLPRAYVDQKMVEQMVANLLTNAVRYTHSRHGRVEVSCYTEADDVVIVVKDNGIGIPKVEQAHIFERFYRARNAVNIEEQGTGLGLYIVQSLATALGGRVWFESVKGKGTTFYLSLPVK